VNGNLFFGGMRRRASAGNSDGAAEQEFALTAPWRFLGPQAELFLEVQGDAFVSSAEDSVAILLRGLASQDGASPDPRQVVAEVRRHYRQHGDLPVDRLEGSFSLALLDGPAGRVVLYRNLVGNQFTYYTLTPDGLFFGGNLAQLVERAGIPRRPCAAMLPVFFLFRFVPGRHTLFDRCYRLLAGEQLIFDANGLRRSQRQTFASLRGDRTIGRDAVDRIEGTMRAIVGGWAKRQPQTATLLSGGVDSSYLQAIWNQLRTDREPPPSFAVQVDHRLTRIDAAYAVSAAEALGTHHVGVPANGPYAGYLLDTLAATGEPPNHAMTVYFGQLARSMTARGITAGLCGEGADSLFGMGLADTLQAARWIRRLVPTRRLRQLGGALARLAGCDCLPAAFDLAEHVHDPAHWEHPFNRAAVFADWPSVQACFGEDGINSALEYRRGLLVRYAVADDPREQLHGIGYLGEAADSASLWTTIFHRAGGELCCPYLDSRLLRVALAIPPRRRFPYRRPKDLLKQALARHVPRELAYRFKLGFGQPVFEWMVPGGQLRPWVEQIGEYDFVPAAVRTAALARPSWFTYSLLCYDLWHKRFIEQVPSALTMDAKPQAVSKRYSIAILTHEGADAK
jgi:asparagine synthase (glutamine-hydrolysing)